MLNGSRVSQKWTEGYPKCHEGWKVSYEVIRECYNHETTEQFSPHHLREVKGDVWLSMQQVTLHMSLKDFCWTNKYFSNQCICKTTCNTTSRLVLPLLGLFVAAYNFSDSTVYINNGCSSSPSNQVVAHPILIRHRVTLDSESDD